MTITGKSKEDPSDLRGSDFKMRSYICVTGLSGSGAHLTFSMDKKGRNYSKLFQGVEAHIFSILSLCWLTRPTKVEKIQKIRSESTLAWKKKTKRRKLWNQPEKRAEANKPRTPPPSLPPPPFVFKQVSKYSLEDICSLEKFIIILNIHNFSRKFLYDCARQEISQIALKGWAFDVAKNQLSRKIGIPKSGYHNFHQKTP